MVVDKDKFEGQSDDDLRGTFNRKSQEIGMKCQLWKSKLFTLTINRFVFIKLTFLLNILCTIFADFVDQSRAMESLWCENCDRNCDNTKVCDI